MLIPRRSLLWASGHESMPGAETLFRRNGKVNDHSRPGAPVRFSGLGDACAFKVLARTASRRRVGAPS